MAMKKFVIAPAVWALFHATRCAQAQAAEVGSSSTLDALEQDDECAVGDEACALNALQLKGLQQQHSHAAGTAAGAAAVWASTEAQTLEGCHTVSEQDRGECWGNIQWAMHDGHTLHPDWYPGLDPATSSIAEWQAKIYSSPHSPCPRPCGMAKDPSAFACTQAAPAPLWRPKEGSPNNVKVLSYNLFWWSLFRQRGGNGNSAGRLIQQANQDEPFDVMGFQECEDPERVLQPVGLLDDFEAFQGTHAICMAYSKKTWTLLDHGQEDVAEDMRTEFYGTRGSQWMRLQRKETGETLLFLNHHGPLSVNSGGDCGGKATAYSLLDLMHAKGQPGDLIILVGDFNANAASLTIQSLWPHLVQVYSGDSFGGVDNIFSNAASGAIVRTTNLGSGGSDHNAISAVVSTGTPKSTRTVMASNRGPEPVTAIADLTGAGKAGDAWEKFWCGTIENNVKYTFPDGHLLRYVNGISDPRMCCKLCQRESSCKGFQWAEWSEKAHGPSCMLQTAAPDSKQYGEAGDGFVSGLPVTQAVKEAAARGSMSINAIA